MDFSDHLRNFVQLMSGMIDMAEKQAIYAKTRTKTLKKCIF